MSNTIDNTQETIDSRDIIERIEELENELEGLKSDSPLSWVEWCAAYVSYHHPHRGKHQDEVEELKALKALAAECEHVADWVHGEQLIREDYFTQYIEDLIDDCYQLPKELTSGEWPYRHITIDYQAAADEAKVDYEEIDFGGVTYFIRSV